MKVSEEVGGHYVVSLIMLWDFNQRIPLSRPSAWKIPRLIPRYQ